ncbi:hypothetical protein KSS87_015835, partial [Heliosperma pusillum]
MEASSDVVCPIVQVRLEEEKHKAAACFVLLSKSTLFQLSLINMVMLKTMCIRCIKGKLIFKVIICLLVP